MQRTNSRDSWIICALVTFGIAAIWLVLETSGVLATSENGLFLLSIGTFVVPLLCCCSVFVCVIVAIFSCCESNQSIIVTHNYQMLPTAPQTV
jgi:hypothetical protein